MALITILKPIMVASIDDPPYDMIGRGDPTIGNSPKTIHMFTEMYMKIAEAKPKQNNLPKKLLD